MALVRMQTRPGRMFTSLNTPTPDFDRLFSGLAGTTGSLRNDYAADLYETEDKLVLEMTVPGLTANDLDISVEDGQLIVNSSAVNQDADKNDGEDEERRYWLQSISRKEFSRTLKLPKSVDVEGISAHVENGLLTLTMPKAAEARIRKIEVKTRNAETV